MLGSVHDADDALQEALLGAWKGRSGFEGRSSLRSWLYTIATNASLRILEGRKRRALPGGTGSGDDPRAPLAEPLAESVWVEPYPDESLGLADELAAPDARYEQRESVELAFIAALQHLPARQRAVLILREVLGFTGAEVADALETTPDAVYSALQRAHRTVDERLPERTQQATLRSLGDEKLREIVEGFVHAWEHSDIDTLAAKLAEDAVLTMPPLSTWYRGRDTIGAFLKERPLSGKIGWRIIPTRANGQPAFALYNWDDEGQAFAPHGIAVLTLDGHRIDEITIFLNPETLTRFGLPESIEP
jgi:RNA polymerase sigma-70 factor, ECF subfamily